MPAAIKRALNYVRTYHLHTLSSLWKITRKDGTVLRFTDHDKPIIFDDATYSPGAGFDASARQKQSGLKDNNLELKGVLSSSLIGHDDLRAGKFNDALVEEFLVDFIRPWYGFLTKNVYWIKNVTYDGNEFQSEIAGIASRIDFVNGKRYTRDCTHDLGDSVCRVKPEVFTFNAVVVDTTDVTHTTFDARREFNTTINDLNPIINVFRFGEIQWLTGSNAGLKFEIEASQGPELVNGNARGVIKLRLRMPFDVATGDIMIIRKGCEKTSSSTYGCKSYPNPDNASDPDGNFINFGGFPHIPGTDAVIQSPNAKSPGTESGSK